MPAKEALLSFELIPKPTQCTHRTTHLLLRWHSTPTPSCIALLLLTLVVYIHCSTNTITLVKLYIFVSTHSIAGPYHSHCGSFSESGGLFMGQPQSFQYIFCSQTYPTLSISGTFYGEVCVCRLLVSTEA